MEPRFPRSRAPRWTALLRLTKVPHSTSGRVLIESPFDTLAACPLRAGSWYANPVGPVGHAPIAAGILIFAAGGAGKPLDYDEFGALTRVGFKHGSAARLG